MCGSQRTGKGYGTILFWFIAVMTAGLLVGAPGEAEEEGKKEAPVSREKGRLVARIGRREIYEREVRRRIQQLPPEERGRYAGESGLAAFTREYVRDEAVLEKAKKQGVDGQTDVLWEIEDFAQKLIVDTYLKEEAERRLTIEPREVRLFYHHAIRLFTDPNKAKIRKIKANNEDKAKKILARIARGEDFVALARAESEDGVVNEEADDWGYITGVGHSDQLAAVLFSLEAGEITGEPVPYGGAYYIFQMVEKLPREDKGFEDVKDRVEQIYRDMKLSGERRKIEKEAFDEAGAEIFVKQPLE